MRAEYKTMCVKFRTDDAAQMRAWEYLRKHVSEKPYSALIADMVSAMTCERAATDGGSGAESDLREQMNRMEQMLMEIKAICTAATDGVGRSLPPTDAIGAVQPESDQAEEARHENEMPQKFLDFVLGMGGDPDEDE